MSNLNKSGLIWITGFSAAGKTTVGRKVEHNLRNKGFNTIFLDGDDLRSILGCKWGYSNEDRLELAQVYFRLSSHLASQGYVVVIAAVAMYKEIYDWIHEHIPNALQVYLEVSEKERISRDGKTKKIYGALSNDKLSYEEPTYADLIVNNNDQQDINLISDRIVDFYLSNSVEQINLGRTAHWNDFYNKNVAPLQQSSFADFVVSYLAPESDFLEIGCGNGRDAAFFSHRCRAVTAIDLSEAAIDKCKLDYKNLGIEFYQGLVHDLKSKLKNKYNAIYSRFVLHAMPLHEEVKLLESCSNLLTDDGLFFIECRSILDPMSRLGKVISPTERIHGHYRRFIIIDDLIERLSDAGFDVAYSSESSGISAHGDDDPVVIRIIAKLKQ